MDTGLYREGWLYHQAGVDFPASTTQDVRRVTDQDLQGVDAVVHLAELSNDPLGEFNPQLTFLVNHRGSVAFADACRRAGVSRFVYSSSCSVYGFGDGDWKDEQSEVNPLTAYAECKVLVERDIAKLADDRFSPVFLRNGTAYGPSPRMRFDLVVNNLAGLAQTVGEIRMISDGTPWRPLVHVLDICEAMSCSVEAPQEVVHGQTFNVGDTRENYQIRQVAEIVAEVFPSCSVSVGPSGGDNRSYRVNFDKIQAQLPGFRCRHDVRGGAAQLREIFARIQLDRETFESRAYTRLKQLRHLVDTKQLDEYLFWQPFQEQPTTEGAACS
jgi:nucleoside-diphosphate-sugar epimerase